MSDESTGAALAVSEAPETPSTAPDQTAPDPETRRQEIGREFMKQALGRVGKTSAASRPTEEKASRQPADGTETDESVTLTKAELDRRIQAETDRREAKRQRDAEAKAKRDQERWEMDNDPQAFVERKRQEEAQQEQQTQAQQAIAAMAADYQAKVDRAVIDPVFLELPESAQQAILRANPFQGDTLKHRQDITKASLAALKKHWKAEGAAEAEVKIRRNPAIIKQQLVDIRDESDNEPVAVSGSVSNGQPKDMNTWIRRSLGRTARA